MTNDAVSNLRGAVSLFFYAVNTLFWVIPIFLLAILKLAVPVSPFRKFCDRILNRCAENWIGFNNLNQDTFTNTTFRVFGMENLDRRSWYLVVSNHQTWVDILVLQRIFHRRIPFLKFFLKKELFWFPVLGQAWWALDFPFMKRYTRRFLEKNPHLRGRDLAVTRKACEKFKTIPVSVMNFVEGTRFTPKKHDRQGSPYRNLLKPRAGGIAFVIGAMGEYLDSMIDVTIAYPGGAAKLLGFSVRQGQGDPRSGESPAHFPRHAGRLFQRRWVSRRISELGQRPLGAERPVRRGIALRRPGAWNGNGVPRPAAFFEPSES